MVGTAPRLTARQIKIIPRELGVVVQACDPRTREVESDNPESLGTQMCVYRHGQLR